jgi:hypothetical protein
MTTMRAALPAEIQAVAERLREALRSDGSSPSDFDIDRWLQDWLERPQPALGGVAPHSLLSSAHGIEAVRRALGAVLSGAYQ